MPRCWLALLSTQWIEGESGASWVFAVGIDGLRQERHLRSYLFRPGPVLLEDGNCPKEEVSLYVTASLLLY
jgi:hypothetical protein